MTGRPQASGAVHGRCMAKVKESKIWKHGQVGRGQQHTRVRREGGDRRGGAPASYVALDQGQTEARGGSTGSKLPSSRQKIEQKEQQEQHQSQHGQQEQHEQQENRRSIRGFAV